MPIGIDDFRKLRTENFYYIDKTAMIRGLLEKWGKVNQFTRPRRFGKTLNMSMLKEFFEIGSDKTIFDGLEISKEKKLCEEYMGQFPVVSITLKNVDGLTYQSAYNKLINIIPSLTVDRKRDRCIPCIYWATAIFIVVSNYSILFLSLTFFLNRTHCAFGYELVVCPETTDVVKIICDLFTPIQWDKPLLLYPGKIHCF